MCTQQRPPATDRSAANVSANDPAVTDPPVTGTAADLAAIADAPENARLRMINDFLAARQPLFGQLARSICVRFRITPALHADDVRQIVAMTALSMVHEHLRGELGARRFEALLTVRARSEVRAHFDSAGQTPLSEMTTVKRRLRKLGEKRRQLVAELGREPTADEVVRQWNSEARNRFKDPARQGMLATVTDLVDVRSYGDPADTNQPATADPGPLDALEGRAFLGEVLAETHCADPLLGDTAAAWIGGALADPPFVRSPAEIAQLLGVRPRDATAAITAVRGIAGRILTDRYGIAAPTPWDAAGLSA